MKKVNYPIQAIVGRKEAIQKGLTKYFTGKPCIHGHIVERFTLNSVCTECHKAHSKATLTRHRQEILAQRAKIKAQAK